MDDPSYRPGDWLIGRSTYFDAPASWKAKFAPHLFGDLHGNGCGSFTNKGPGLESNDNFTLPLDQAAAIADFDPRFYEGACGTCFEIGCITGPILDVATPENQTKLPLEAGGSTDGRSFYDVDQNALDSYNRTVPGENVLVDPVSGVEWEYTRCWNESRTIYVTIVDVCPCQYSWGTQSICCGPVPHFDLSYWAHEHLAHPTQGKMMLRFRPVNCDTKEPVDARRGASARMGVADVEEKGRRLSMLNGGGDGQRVFVSNASSELTPRTVPVYRDAISPGWSFNAYKDQWAEISKRGHGAGGSAALCVSVSPGGRMALRCTNCQDTVKPFARVQQDRPVGAIHVRHGAALRTTRVPRSEHDECVRLRARVHAGGGAVREQDQGMGPRDWRDPAGQLRLENFRTDRRASRVHPGQGGGGELSFPRARTWIAG